MKKITIKLKQIAVLSVLLLSSFAYSQDLLLGFQPGESGGVNGGPFGNGPAPIVETGTGTNTTQVLKIVGNPAGEPWQGINLTLTSLVNLTTIKTMTMDVFSATPITFLVKVTGGIGGPAIVAASATHTGGSTWQTISFTFDTSLDGQAAPANGVYSGFVIHTYWATGATGFFNPTVPTPARTFYVDNIRGPLGTPPVEPTPLVAAPTPPNRPVADVKSIFSDSYAPVTAIGYTGDDNTYNTSWCPGTTSLIQVVGNNTNKITGLGCEGIAFLAGRFNATGFTHFHMDIWTATPTQDKSFNFKFSNWNGTGGETNALQYSASNANVLTSGSQGTWISIDLPLSSFQCINTPPGNACPSVSDFAQFVITSDLGTVFYDNLYLHKNTTLGTADFNSLSFKMFPNLAKDVLHLSSDTTIDSITLYNSLGQIVSKKISTSNETSIDVSTLSNGAYIVTAQIGNELVRKQFIKM